MISLPGIGITQYTLCVLYISQLACFVGEMSFNMLNDAVRYASETEIL